jgi:hypothetical protein
VLHHVLNILPVVTGILCCDSGRKRPRNALDRVAEPDNSVLPSRPGVFKPEGQPWSTSGRISGLGNLAGGL